MPDYNWPSMSNKRPVNLTLNERVLEFAEQIMELRGHSSLSAFIEELVRDEYERRNGPMVIQDTVTPPAPAPVAPTPPAKPFSYRGKGRVRVRQKSKPAP